MGDRGAPPFFSQRPGSPVQLGGGTGGYGSSHGPQHQHQHQYHSHGHGHGHGQALVHPSHQGHGLQRFPSYPAPLPLQQHPPSAPQGSSSQAPPFRGRAASPPPPGYRPPMQAGISQTHAREPRVFGQSRSQVAPVSFVPVDGGHPVGPSSAGVHGAPQVYGGRYQPRPTAPLAAARPPLEVATQQYRVGGMYNAVDYDDHDTYASNYPRQEQPLHVEGAPPFDDYYQDERQDYDDQDDDDDDMLGDDDDGDDQFGYDDDNDNDDDDTGAQEHRNHGTARRQPRGAGPPAQVNYHQQTRGAAIATSPVHSSHGHAGHAYTRPYHVVRSGSPPPGPSGTSSGRTSPRRTGPYGNDVESDIRHLTAGPAMSANGMLWHCRQAVHGCPFVGAPQSVEEHLRTCAYDQLKDFLAIQQERLAQQDAEIDRLKATVDQLWAYVHDSDHPPPPVAPTVETSGVDSATVARSSTGRTAPVVPPLPLASATHTRGAGGGGGGARDRTSLSAREVRHRAAQQVERVRRKSLELEAEQQQQQQRTSSQRVQQRTRAADPPGRAHRGYGHGSADQHESPASSRASSPQISPRGHASPRENVQASTAIPTTPYDKSKRQVTASRSNNTNTHNDDDHDHDDDDDDVDDIETDKTVPSSRLQQRQRLQAEREKRERGRRSGRDSTPVSARSIGSTAGDTASARVPHKIVTAVRIAPLTQEEMDDKDILRIQGKKISVQNPSKADEKLKVYRADHVFGGPTPDSQSTMYENLGHPLLRNILLGNDCALIGYGPNATGKSFTLFGSDQAPGLFPRLCDDLLVLMNQVEPDEVPRLSASNMEISVVCIHNEQAFDMLNFNTNQPKWGESKNKTSLRPRETKSKTTYLEGAVFENVTSYSEIDEYLSLAREGQGQLRPSHLLVTLRVSLLREDSDVPEIATLVVVECESSNYKMPKGQKNVKSIAAHNKSLAAVVNLLSDINNEAPRVRYRDSILTRLLHNIYSKPKSVTTLVSVVKDTGTAYDDTISALRFSNGIRRTAGVTRKASP